LLLLQLLLLPLLLFLVQLSLGPISVIAVCFVWHAALLNTPSTGRRQCGRNLQALPTFRQRTAPRCICQWQKNQFCTRLPNAGRGDIWPWTALVTTALKSAKPMNSPLNTEAVMKKLTIRMTTSLISTRAQTDRTTHHARRGSWLRQGPVDMLHCEGGQATGQRPRDGRS
jgi:hypothetical protein